MSNAFATPWTVARQALLSVEFSRQEYRCGFPFPSPGDRPYPEVKLGSLVSAAFLHADSLPAGHLGSLLG